MIRVAVGDLDEDLLDRDAVGMHLCGITADGALTHDPDEGDEHCVVIELRVESDLEPRWSFYRPDEAGEPTPVRASVRAKFRAYRVDDRVDTHLRWSRTSALGRLTENRNGTRGVLLAAHRAARHAVAQGVGEELTALTAELQDRIADNGSGQFRALRPGLDLSLPQAQGNLALHEGEIPLTGFGLGTRRLVGTAIQQLAHPGESVLLVDELEHGLEPHRVAHLAGRLRTPGSFGQVIVTTHSPTVLQSLDARDLSTVRRGPDGTVEARELGPELQGVLRACPAAFLARHVLVAEGKTELGIATHLIERWDQQRRTQSPALAPAAALGLCPIEGGGSSAPERARQLREAGYDITFLLDGDRDDANDAAATLAAAGVGVVRWPDGHNTEKLICAHLSPTGLRDLIGLALEGLTDDLGLPEDSAEHAVTQRLRAHLPSPVSDPLDPTTWEHDGIGLDAAQTAVAQAAADSKPDTNNKKKKGWFKTVEGGKRLGRLLAEHPELAQVDAVTDPLQQLREYIYTGYTGETCIDPPPAALADQPGAPEPG